MKSKFFSDNILPLNKAIEIYIMTIIARAVFHEKKKILSTHFFRRMLIQIIKCYDRIDVSEGIDVNKTSAVRYLSLLVFLKL